MVDSDVLIDLARVCVSDLFVIDARLSPDDLIRFSRSLSKITIVSFTE